MLITLNGKQKSYAKAITLAGVVKDLLPGMNGRVLGALTGGRVVELDSILREDHVLQSIDYTHEEDRRIYERSLRFVFLMAVKRCFPEAHVRVEHSIGHGIYMVLEKQRLYPNDVITLEGVMRDIVMQDMPFVKKQWSRDEAIAYFSAQGESEKARLLAYRPFDYFNVYESGDIAEYFYGAMLPSTGWVPVFALHPRAPGLVMLLPSPENPAVPAPYLSQPKHMATFAQSNYWCRILECSDAADLNDLIKRNRFRDFVRVNEALHDKSLATISDDIIARGSRAIFIAGPSSSGKTTFANRLSIHLRVNGLNPVLISLDDFYLDRDSLPLEEDGQPDLEALDAIDVKLFKQCVASLLTGKETPIPRFNFALQRRDKSIPVTIGPDQPLIIEGIHGLNPALYEGFAAKMLFRIYISQLTCLNLDNHNRIRTTDARLLRRIVRDHQFRDTPPTKTLAMWDKVRRGEDKWIFPYQENCDVMFNSALHYELPVLKLIAYDLLRGISKDDPNYLRCSRILKILNYLLPAPQETLNEIPPLSILREFIGGNTLYLSRLDDL